MTRSSEGSPRNPMIPRSSNVKLATSRMSRSPMPGEPPGNVEYHRRKKAHLVEVKQFPVRLKAQKECQDQLFRAIRTR
jgi:hypothetical protein